MFVRCPIVFPNKPTMRWTVSLQKTQIRSNLTPKYGPTKNTVIE